MQQLSKDTFREKFFNSIEIDKNVYEHLTSLGISLEKEINSIIDKEYDLYLKNFNGN